MAFSIMTNKDLIGKSIDFIRENLGVPDGFYFIDIYPAYIIQEGFSAKEETWQIVFKLNEKYEVRKLLFIKIVVINIVIGYLARSPNPPLKTFIL